VKIRKRLRTTRLNSEFTDSYWKKSGYKLRAVFVNIQRWRVLV